MTTDRLVRSRNERWIAGVCGGIAARLGWPPTLVRVVWLLFSLFPGPLWVLYVGLWLFLPEAET